MSSAKFEYVCPKCGQPRSYTPKSLEQGVCRNKDCKHPFTPEAIESVKRGLAEARKDRKIGQVIGKTRPKNLC